MISTSSSTIEMQVANHGAVPDWHRPWIAEHARQIAQQTFLAAISDVQTINTSTWEAAGLVVIHDVYRALVLTDNAETARKAAHYGAKCFLRVFFGLALTSSEGGRA